MYIHNIIYIYCVYICSNLASVKAIYDHPRIDIILHFPVHVPVQYNSGPKQI